MAKTRSDSPSLFETLPPRPDFSTERHLHLEGYKFVVGLDEVGRGPLAGPVVAAAVILDPENIPDGLNDSKLLNQAAREAICEEILSYALSVSVASLSAPSIDASNILRASLEAMRRAVEGLSCPADFALVDGRDIPPGLSCSARALIKGDQRSQSIAAASIVAKVMRDRIMARYAKLTPHFGFETNAGYATAKHRTAIEQFGPVLRIHRMSFAPMRITKVGSDGQAPDICESESEVII